MTAVTSGEAQLGLPAGARACSRASCWSGRSPGASSTPGTTRSCRRASSRPASTCASARWRTGSAAASCPTADPVDAKLKDFVIDELDIRRDGAVLETNRPYLIPLMRGARPARPTSGARPTRRARPAGSTSSPGSITDHGFRFDEIAAGYRGPLYLEVVPLSFTVRVQQGLALNQLRLAVGDTRLDRRGHPRAARPRAAAAPRRGRPSPTASSRPPTASSSGSTCAATATGGSGTAPRTTRPLLEMSRVG